MRSRDLDLLSSVYLDIEAVNLVEVMRVDVLRLSDPDPFYTMRSMHRQILQSARRLAHHAPHL